MSDMTKSRRNKIIALILIIIFVAGVIIGAAFLGVFLYKPDIDEIRMLAYITSDSVTDDGSLVKYDFSKTTHIIYAFAYIDGTTFEVYVDKPEALQILSQYLKKNYPEVKLMLSVASAFENDGFCDTAHVDEKRSGFAKQCVALMTKYELDGIDIDWEYPGFKGMGRKICSSCSSDHEKLLATLRSEMPDGAILSFAGAGSSIILNKYKNRKLAKIVDFVNVMLYDFSLDNNGNYGYSKNIIYEYNLAGYSKTQLNFGLPFYGRSENKNLDYLSYAQLCEMVERGEGKLVEQTNTSIVQIYGGGVSFDSKEKISAKVKYVKKTGYGGLFCWHLACDRNNELLTIIYDELK